MDARTIAQKAMSIAADACIYTNTNFTALSIDSEGKIHDWEVKAVASGGNSSDAGVTTSTVEEKASSASKTSKK
jgi:hypothetical protein